MGGVKKSSANNNEIKDIKHGRKRRMKQNFDKLIVTSLLSVINKTLLVCKDTLNTSNNIHESCNK